MTKQSQQRIYYLDSMRAMLMLLGIVIHSAQIFSPKNVFPIINERTSTYMFYLVEIFHLFRMPAFFVVSGFFCYMTLEKYGERIFLSVKIKRILIPLVVTLISLNLSQFLILKHMNIINTSFENYIKSGRYIEHLWFLVDLLYFFVITAFAHNFIKKISYLKVFEKRIFSSAFLIFFLPLISIFIMGLNKLGIEIYINYWGVFNPYRLLYNYVFFAFGYFLFKNAKLYFSIINKNSLFYLSLLIACVIYHSIDKKSISELIFHEYTYILSQWCSIALCFKVFKFIFDRPSQLSKMISDSSYTIYLFHFFILMLFSSYLVNFNFNPFLGFIVTLVFVSLASFLVHVRVINRFKIMKLLFNGK